MNKGDAPPNIFGEYLGKAKVLAASESEVVAGLEWDKMFEYCPEMNYLLTGDGDDFSLWLERIHFAGSSISCEHTHDVELWSGSKNHDGGLTAKVLTVYLDVDPLCESYQPGDWILNEYNLSLKAAGCKSFDPYLGYHGSGRGDVPAGQTVIVLRAEPGDNENQLSCNSRRDGQRYITIYASGDTAATYQYFTGDLNSLLPGYFKAELADWSDGQSVPISEAIGGMLELDEAPTEDLISGRFSLFFPGWDFIGRLKSTACDLVQ